MACEMSRVRSLSAAHRGDKLFPLSVYSRRMRFRDLDKSLVRDRVWVALGWIAVALLVFAGAWALINIPRWQVNELVTVSTRDQVKVFELENEARRTLT